MAALLPSSKVWFAGVRTDSRTAKALAWAEKRSGLKFACSQGSWSTSVSASGSTHAGSGVVDIRVGSWSNTQRSKVVRALRDAGFAAWLRTPAQGFPYHIHAVCIDSPGLSASAARQVAAYDQGKDGLDRGARDSNPYRPAPKVRFSWLRNKPVPRKAT